MWLLQLKLRKSSHFLGFILTRNLRVNKKNIWLVPRKFIFNNTHFLIFDRISIERRGFIFNQNTNKKRTYN